MMPDTRVEEALQLANNLEASDTLEGYRGARTIRALADEYESKVLECEVWLNDFKDAEVRINKLRRERGS